MENHEEYDDRMVFRDAQTDNEVQFLLRGLRQLAIDPQAEVPANFHARVMDQARSLPPPRPRLWDRIGVRRPIWVPVLAMGLILSLGVHVWQSLRAIGVQAPGVRQVVEQPHTDRTAATPLPTYAFQGRLRDAPTLGAVVKARPVPQAPRSLVGFMPHAARPTFVRLGILYADTLAALQSGAREAAQSRLDRLLQLVTPLHAPVLAQYLQEMQAMLQRQPPLAASTVAQFMALFEALYGAVYATDPTAPPWLLFHAGAFLEDLALAAAVGDYDAVQQAETVQAIQAGLRALDLPDTVLHSLAQLRDLVAQRPRTAAALQAVQALVDAIQQQLQGGTP